MRRLQSYTSLPANPQESALSPLAKKLRLKSDHIIAVLNSPPGYLETLEPGPMTIVTELKPDVTYDAVQLFVTSVDELRGAWAAAARAVKPDGVLWITYPKGALKNNALAETFTDAGLTPRALVKIDERWTAASLRKA